MWICEDDEIGLDLKQEVESVQPGGGSVAVKPPGYYVNRESGLFPAPLPQDNNIIEGVFCIGSKRLTFRVQGL